uniref:Uncharacterized protein n=1 Tax=Desulfacinum infernum TaxID=35837 RepID=A0A831ZQ77_9BACT
MKKTLKKTHAALEGLMFDTFLADRCGFKRSTLAQRLLRLTSQVTLGEGCLTVCLPNHHVADAIGTGERVLIRCWNRLLRHDLVIRAKTAYGPAITALNVPRILDDLAEHPRASFLAGLREAFASPDVRRFFRRLRDAATRGEIPLEEVIAGDWWFPPQAYPPVGNRTIHHLIRTWKRSMV